MPLRERLENWTAGWRGPAIAAFVALIAALPGALALPPIDRDESRFAEATAQMLESGDYVAPRFQDEPRFKKPVGIYWLQAAAVAAVSHVEDRDIWAYRIPSLLGAMLAAAACAWGASCFLSTPFSTLAGGLLGASILLSTEADIAATDGALAGVVTLTMAALGRAYCQAKEGEPPKRSTRILMWLGLALSVLIKGPIGPLVFVTAILALVISERRQSAWMRTLGWGWGLILIAAVNLPWAVAITVATDGGFWGAAIGGDLAPKLVSGAEGHGAPPGFYLATLPLLIFPATAILPAAAVLAWRERMTPWVRFALCWLVPAWLLFEATPTKLIHYPLPLYGAIFWLIAGALERGFGRTSRWIGAALLLAAAAGLSAAGLALAPRITTPVSASIALTALILGAIAGAVLLLRGRSVTGVLAAAIGGVLAHGVLLSVVAPRLQGFWLSSRVAAELERLGASPLDGLAPGPVTVAGYEEPSLVFLLGADTELGAGADAARAVLQGRPAIVEAAQESAFRAALGSRTPPLRTGAPVSGLDYSNNHKDTLTVYAPVRP